jgi:hypothetical protein
MSFSSEQDGTTQSEATLSAWREEINDYIAALKSWTAEDWQSKRIAHLLKKGGPAFRNLRSTVEELEGPLLAAKREAELRAARADAERRMAVLAPEAKQYFDRNPMHLTGACWGHDTWGLLYEAPVEYVHLHGSFGKRNAEIWRGRIDYCRDYYVGRQHPFIVNVDRRPGEAHLRRHVEMRNNLLMRSYQPGSWSDEPVTLVRAQGGLEGWKEVEQFVYESGDTKERAREALFGTWRQSLSFLSAMNSRGPLSYKATVYLIYHVEAKCPLMDVAIGQEYVIPPGVEMRARRVAIQKDYSRGVGHDIYFYVVEVDVRRSATYVPSELSLPEVYDKYDEMETDENMERLGWHAQPVSKRRKANE